MQSGHSGNRTSTASTGCRLYTSAASEKSQRALRAVKEVLKEYEPGQVNFSTCDLSVRPQDAEADSIVFTPTLVTHGSGPRTAIIGNLDDQSSSRTHSARFEQLHDRLRIGEIAEHERARKRIALDQHRGEVDRVLLRAVGVPADVAELEPRFR